MMNAVFIHIPRTAGRYIMATLGLQRLIYRRKISQFFKQEGAVTFGHQSYDALVRKRVVSQAFDKSAFKFTFCRNPFDRVVSHYYHARKYHRDVLPQDVSFTEFVLNLEKYNVPRRFIEGAKLTFRPQYQSIKLVNVDFIGRFETLMDSIRTVADRIGVTVIDVEPIGVTRHRPYATYYNDDTEEKVRTFYKGDFERFGYDDSLLH